MGNSVKIDTEAVKITADKLGSISQQATEAINEAGRCVLSLGNDSWRSDFVNPTTELFHKRMEFYSNQLGTVFNNYQKYLYNQVSDGYTATENANKELSQYFK